MSYNLRNPADNIFEWHFVIRGAWDTEFEGGIYHGRILMPAEYPFKPPAFVMLTPSGRFETGTKICLSISSFHPESWQPSWSVRSALTALIAFMQTPGNGAVGSIDTASDVRKQLAKEARSTPPKHSNSDVQELINAQHQKLLDLEEKSRSLYRRGGSPEAAAVAINESGADGNVQLEGDSGNGVAAADVAFSLNEEIVSSEEETRKMFQPHEELPAATPTSRSPFLEATAAIETPLFQPEEQQQQNEETPSTRARTSIPSEEREAQFQPQSSPLLHQPTPSSPLSPSPAATVAGISTTISNSWEDKGLSLLALLLGAMLAAVLLRRVVLAFNPTASGGSGSGGDPLLFSVNPLADFDIEL